MSFNQISQVLTVLKSIPNLFYSLLTNLPKPPIHPLQRPAHSHCANGNGFFNRPPRKKVSQEKKKETPLNRLIHLPRPPNQIPASTAIYDASQGITLLLLRRGNERRLYVYARGARRLALARETERVVDARG